MMEPITYHTASLVLTALDYDPMKHVNLETLNLLIVNLSFILSAFAHHRIKRFMAPSKLIEEIDSAPEPAPRCPRGKIRLQVRTSTSTATVHPGFSLQKSLGSPSAASKPGTQPRYIVVPNSAQENQSSSSKAPQLPQNAAPNDGMKLPSCALIT